MKNIDFKKWLPYLAAIVLFAGLTLSYFKPITDGYELRQADVINYKGMAKEIQDFRKIYGQEPLWTNSMFGGMPAYQIDVQNSSNILLKIDRVLQLGFPGVIGYFFLMFIGFYILMLCMNVDPWLAIVGAVAYAFSSYFMIIVEAGHNTKVHALAYAPAVLGGFLLLMRGRIWLGAAVFTFFLALQLLSNHVQITYYLFLLLFIIGVGEFIKLIKEKGVILNFAMRTGLVGLAGTLAVMASSSNLWNTYEYGKDTTRGASELTISADGKMGSADKGLDKDYITGWSYGIDESWTFVFPSAKGAGSGYILSDKDFQDSKKVKPQVKAFIQEKAMESQQSQGRSGFMVNRYWGDQPFTSGPTYMGALVVFLFVLSFVFVTDPLKWAVLIASVLFLMLGWGRNLMGFTEFFIENFPGYNKFRSVSMIISMIELVMPFMAILFVKEVITKREEMKAKTKKFLLASGITGGFLLLVVLVPQSFISFLSESDLTAFANERNPIVSDLQSQLVDYRVGVFRADALRSLGFILAGFLLLYFYITKSFSRNLLVAGLGVLIIADLYSFDRRYLNNEKENGQYISWQKKGDYPYYPTEADMSVLQQEATADPSLMTKVQQEMSNVKVEKGQNLELAQIVDGAFPALNFASNYRVLELGDPFNSSRTSYFHKSVGGYHGAKMKRYQELIEFAIRREHNMAYGFLMQVAQNNVPANQIPSVLMMSGLFERTHVLNMLNTKYLILDSSIPAALNPKARGAAWFARNVRFVESANEEVLAVANLEPAETLQVARNGKTIDSVTFRNTNYTIEDSVLVDRRFAEKIKNQDPGFDSMAFVKVESYLPNQIIYKSNSSEDGFVVFSEIYYDKGWTAYLDGTPVDYVRVNYILRGMDVPKGEHTIEFKFEPAGYYSMKSINLTGNLLVLLFVGLFVFLEFRKPKKAIA